MDYYNGEILTVEMRDNMKKELCIDTVYQLKQRCGNLQGVSLYFVNRQPYTSVLRLLQTVENPCFALRKAGIFDSLKPAA